MPISRLISVWPFTIKTYAMGFIIVVLLCVGILSWAMQDKLDTIRSEAQKNNQSAARDELARATAHLTTEIKQLAQGIASQEETRQHLINPAYYGYWRDSRILVGGMLPGYTEAVELYTRQGSALAEQPANNMPKTIAHGGDNGFLLREGTRDHLYIFQPILADMGNPGSVLGYIGIKLDFLHALKTEHHFSRLDTDSIRVVQGNDQERLPAEQLLARLTFQLKSSPESAALIDVISRFKQNIVFVLIALSLAFFYIFNSLLATPLRRLSLHIDTLREGQNGLLMAGFTGSLPVAELEKVRISLNDYQGKLNVLHSSLSEKNDELWSQAHHDPLTGIYNRRCFEEDWESIRSVAAGHRLDVSFILFDCDHFKAINDSYGHHIGDQVLQAIAQTLQNTLRQGDRLYRLGGDEFATIFLDTDPDLAFQVTERCIEHIKQYDFSSLAIKEPVRISCGVAHAQGTNPDALATLPKQADIAMYYAKRPGTNKVAVYHDDMTNDAGILFSTRLNSAVFEAMTAGNDTVEMHYQPVVNLANGKVDYYEALVRIRDGHELIMPASIFPIIEARRLESEFDLTIIDRIARDIEQGKIPPDTGISFNVSGPGVINPKIIEKLLALDHHLERYHLILEVTETALITQLHQASANLNKLRQAGFKIALDDFGSGYSSLSYLANMPVDIVKFDISMICHLGENHRQSAIVENLATLIIKAGYHLVAEGIESDKTLQKISQIGFARGQGYLLGRPHKTCQDTAKISFFDTTK